ncbi:hypothetical protein SESBI_32576 [Sesbania bispinosa]|nr:hypothetical protein SESBI_32576 [Sesbania bispinosa]
MVEPELLRRRTLDQSCCGGDEAAQRGRTLDRSCSEETHLRPKTQLLGRDEMGKERRSIVSLHRS